MHKNPTSQQIQTVIDNFRKVPLLARTPISLSMDCSGVNIMGACGTPHCHGGWYGYVTHSTTQILKQKIDFIKGANRMANDLGFSRMCDLQNWAHCNPEIWGNSYAIHMFSDECAFKSDNRPYGAKSVGDIINHWKEVRDRIIALEKEEERKNVKYPDITPELAKLPQDEVPDVTVKEQLVNHF